MRGRAFHGGFVMASTLLFIHSARAQDREWIVVPYIWGADTSLDVRVNDDPVFGGTLDFSDLVDQLDAAFQIHVETRKGATGLFFDFTYIDASDSFQAQSGPSLPGGTTIATGLEMRLSEAGWFFRPSGARYGLDILLGLRNIEQDIHVIITPPAPLNGRTVNGSTSIFDGFAGVRYSAPLGEKWLLSLRGDVGAGDSDLSLNASVLLGYHFGDGDKYTLLFGYRYFAVQYKENDGAVPIDIDMTMSGPELGFAFLF